MKKTETIRKIASDSAIIAGGNLVRSLLQAGLLIIVARSLPLETYGKLVVLASIASIALPLTGLGYEYEVLRSSSTGKSINDSWHKFNTLFATSLLALSAITIIIGFLLLDNSFSVTTIAVVICSDLTAIRIVEGANRIYQGQGDQVNVAYNRIILPGTRLIIVGATAAIVGTLEITHYSIACAASSIITITTINIQLHKHKGIRIGLCKKGMEEWNKQLPSAISFTLDRITGNADKILLNEISSPSEAANFSVACRIIEILTIPMLAIVTALQPAQFREKSKPHSLIHLTSIPIIYLTITTPLLYWLSEDIIITLLGNSYKDADTLLIMLVFFPATSYLKYSLSSQAIALGSNKIIATSTMASAITSITINTTLIPIMGAPGSAIALLSGETIAITLLFKGLRKR